MKAIVLDSSAALAWCFLDEVTPTSEALLARLATTPGLVPTLWYLEIANILAVSRRNQRIDTGRIHAFFAILDRLALRVDDSAHTHAFSRLLDLAHSEKLTVYDATYLELALRFGAPLASKDKALCAAAKRLGVEVLDA